jgi:uncharacterized protein
MLAGTSHLLYLHGFRSSPQSFKAQAMDRWVREHRPDVVWCCPQLPASPKQGMRLIDSLTADWPVEGMAVVGSSLGGFYAHLLAERRGCRAVLLNPAIHPGRDLARYVGEQALWQSPQDKIFFKQKHVTELLEMESSVVSGHLRYMSIIAKGDEVLDWREMHDRFLGTQMVLLDGGDHALSDFSQQHLSAVLEFLHL